MILSKSVNFVINPAFFLAPDLSSLILASADCVTDCNDTGPDVSFPADASRIIFSASLTISLASMSVFAPSVIIF